MPCDTPVRIRAHHRLVRELGPWTTQRHLDVGGSGSAIVLDLLLPRIEPGEIEVHLDIDHSMVKLLVPDGAVIDDDELRRVGRCRLKDWSGVPAAGGRRIRLLGELRRSEVRIHRGGVAIVSLVASGRARDVRQAHRDGRLSGDVAR